MTTERKRGSKGMPRTELVAVRFDPRTKYLLELAARTQRRSTANFVEWAVEDVLRRVEMNRQDGHRQTLEEAGNVLWHVDEPVRLSLLNKFHPHLLTYEEQRLVKLLDEAIVLAGGSVWPPEQQAAYLGPHLDLLKQAAAEGLTIADVRDDLAADNPKHVDARIAKLTGDLEKLKAMKKAAPSPAPAKKAK